MTQSSNAHAKPPQGGRHRDIGLFLGPLVAVIMLFLPPPEGLEAAGWRTAAVGALMAIWWASEALPVAATALTPLVLFPLLGVFGISEAAAPFANHLIYLFLGGFFIALAIQRWDVHLRVALAFLSVMSSSPKALIAGFMMTTAFLSMWVSNTATTIMMLPVALAVIALMGTDDDGRQDVVFARTLMLSIAYSASVGGLATLVGTAPNALLAAFIADEYGTPIGFARWMMMGLPVSIVMLGVIWFSLTRRTFHGAAAKIDDIARHLVDERAKLGPLRAPQKRVIGVFLLTATLWVFRPLVASQLGLPGLTDSGIAIFGALLMFALPADWKSREFLLNWPWARRAPWDVLLLFGGGLSLAKAINETGLALWMGEALISLGALPVAVLVMGIVGLVIFLTELTSNTATTIAFLPVIASLAQISGLDPLQLAIPAALAASCAFMLPVATPPNAIVFGAGHVTIPDMVRAGFILNLAGIIVITLTATALVPWIFSG